ncbi:F0F1 ATP synthase subunit epsilon [soil metagenome]
MAEDYKRLFDVSLVTPDGPAFEGEAEMLIVPGAAGEIGVLARHAPLIATLKAGSTRIHIDRDSENVKEYATGPGSFKVEVDRAIALVDDAVLADEIDEQRAREQLEAAKQELEKVERGESTADRWQLEQRIVHAENQLAVAGRI